MCDHSKFSSGFFVVFAAEKVGNFQLLSKDIKDLEFSQNPKENI